MSSDVLVERFLEKAKLFRQLHIWPNRSELDFEGWLNNFDKGRERELACVILNFFLYFSKEAISKMFEESIGRAGFALQQHFPDWTHDRFISECIYTFIPGETPNPSDSGYLFTRKLRDDLRIPEKNIMEYGDIQSYLCNQSKPTSIIFVDDFVGTGQQCCKAWNINRNKNTNLTLSELAAKHTHKFVYASLIANKKGADSIRRNCEGLILSVVYELGEEYNLFSEKCMCWEDKTIFKEAIKMIYNKSSDIGINSISGVNGICGFNAQGLAIGFEHGIPDAVPAIFYWAENDWNPLMKRVYERH